MGIDSPLSAQLNDLAQDSSWFAHISRWAASDLALLIVITLVAGALVTAVIELRRGGLSYRLLEGGVITLLALALAMGTNQLVGHLWFRPRPFDALASVHLFVPSSPDPSFPSDHATAAFALAFGVGLAIPWLRNVLLVEGVLLSLARVVVGLHYLSDVIAGLLIALVAVNITWMVIARIRPHLRRLVRGTVARVVAVDDHADLESPGASGLLVLGVYALFVGLPLMVEVAADPVRLHPVWLEAMVVNAGWVGLAAVATAVVLWARPLLLQRAPESPNEPQRFAAVES